MTKKHYMDKMHTRKEQAGYAFFCLKGKRNKRKGKCECAGRQRHWKELICIDKNHKKTINFFKKNYCNRNTYVIYYKSLRNGEEAGSC